MPASNKKPPPQQREETLLLGEKGSQPPIGGYLACGCFPVRSRNVGVALAVAVASVAIGFKDWGNSVLPLAMAPMEASMKDPRIHSQLVGLRDIGHALGKTVCFLPSYYLGGATTIAVGSLTNGLFYLAIYLFAARGGYGVLALMVTALSLVKAAIWPAAIQLASRWVDEKHIGRVLGLCIVGGLPSVLGMIAEATNGAILNAALQGSPHGWRLAFLVAGFMSFAASLCAVMLTRGSAVDAGFAPPQQQQQQQQAIAGTPRQGKSHPLERASCYTAAMTFARSARCWLICFSGIGYASCASVTYSFGPLFVTHRYGASPLESSSVKIALALGGALGGISAGFLLDCLSKKGYFGLIVVTGSIGIVANVIWLVLDATGHGSTAAVCLLTAVSSFAINMHWGVTHNKFCVRYGGPLHSSTLSGGVDMVSFWLSTTNAFIYGHLFDDDSDLTALIAWAVVYAIIGHVSMATFGYLDIHESPDPV